ncbi:MAG: thiamine pyrophosphate-dependent dehydrogenase E1 component subunit alpha [Rhodospirillales bacterium]|nr:thiamine pyrophosphate-dependent dehydrogenase E1 component subunit alpha [Rhodospirillales bacterium]
MADLRAGNETIPIQLYREMQLIRRSQEIIGEEYHPADEMRCPIHLCIGQEAAPAALSLHLKSEDVIFSHHRSHGYYLATGAPLDEMVAEFYGKKTGSNGGLAGSQELSHDEYSFYSGTILSGAFALANGTAFSQKYRGTDGISIGVIGDGGMEEGIVFETLNLAAIQKLPVLFLCENNGYSIHTPIADRSLSPHLTTRAKSFGIPAHLLDGNDAMALHEELGRIITEIREGCGPVFVELTTYRHCGHVGPEGDDHFNYRSEEERKKWRLRDPIKLITETLLSNADNKEALGEIDSQIDAKVWAAIRAAKEAPFPLYEDSMTYNLSPTYSPVITEFVDGAVSEFNPEQAETKLGPY